MEEGRDDIFVAVLLKLREWDDGVVLKCDAMEPSRDVALVV